MYQSPKIEIITFNSSDIIVNLASSGELSHPIDITIHDTAIDYE